MQSALNTPELESLDFLITTPAEKLPIKCSNCDTWADYTIVLIESVDGAPVTCPYCHQPLKPAEISRGDSKTTMPWRKRYKRTKGV